MQRVTKIFSIFILAISITVVASTIFLFGYKKGYMIGMNDQISTDQKYLSQYVSATSKPVATSAPINQTTTKPTVIYVTPKPQVTTSWGGPQLWDAVNKARVANGVGVLSTKEGLCTIASIRLNELLQLGTLDGHTGFSALQSRSDIKPIFDSFSDVSEFLVSGATSAQNAVDLWENTLGHKELLTGGQYVWGCTYAQDGFGVAIAAY